MHVYGVCIHVHIGTGVCTCVGGMCEGMHCVNEACVGVCMCRCVYRWAVCACADVCIGGLHVCTCVSEQPESRELHTNNRKHTLHARVYFRAVSTQQGARGHEASGKLRVPQAWAVAIPQGGHTQEMAAMTSADGPSTCTQPVGSETTHLRARLLAPRRLKQAPLP